MSPGSPECRCDPWLGYCCLNAGTQPLGERSLRKGAKEPPVGTARWNAMTPTILVVEDEKLLRWSIGRRLAEAGYEVRDASCGREALDWIARRHEERIDLVLLDVVLPDANGLDLLRSIKDSERGCPVILMTAYGTRETVSEALEHGAAQVVGKPFDIDEVVRLVDSALRRGR